jgi:hypothetical protein
MLIPNVLVLECGHSRSKWLRAIGSCGTFQVGSHRVSKVRVWGGVRPQRGLEDALPSLSLLASCLPRFDLLLTPDWVTASLHPEQQAQ